MALFAASARRRRGELTSDDEGRALVSGADTWMRSHSIRDPERTRICAPRLCRRWRPNVLASRSRGPRIAVPIRDA
jgi:hypothetical protein